MRAEAEFMEIKKGMIVWIDCEVRGGPFPNERRVLVKTDTTEWFGFVSVSELEKKVPEGKDRVRAIVTSVEPNYAIVEVRGQSPASGEIQAQPSFIKRNAPLEA